MNINLISEKDYKFEKGVIIFPLFENETAEFKRLALPDELLAQINSFIESGSFSGKLYQITPFNIMLDGNMVAAILTGLGKQEDITLWNFGGALNLALQCAGGLKAASADVALRKINNADYEIYAEYAARIAASGDYSFDKYKSKKSGAKCPDNVNLIVRHMDISKPFETIAENAMNEAEALALVKDLSNEPANVINPVNLAEIASQCAGKYGYEAQIGNLSFIQELKMGAYLAVAQGAADEPRLIVLRYKGNKDSSSTYALVGKGLTYDSGGYSLKPSSSMDTMYTDMTGAATVIGAMNLIAANNLGVNVTAVIASCANMVSGGAYRPGDIVKAMSGKTIEVNNTDAEGRLTLADAITYAISEENAGTVIDVATLTGAVGTALGDEITGVMSNDDGLYADFRAASEAASEKIHRLPLEKSYKKFLKSGRADMKNSGGRFAGTITAGLFLSEFTDNAKWIHFDIAATARCSKATELMNKGATGVMVMTLYKYFEMKSSILDE